MDDIGSARTFVGRHGSDENIIEAVRIVVATAIQHLAVGGHRAALDDEAVRAVQLRQVQGIRRRHITEHNVDAPHHIPDQQIVRAVSVQIAAPADRPPDHSSCFPIHREADAAAQRGCIQRRGKRLVPSEHQITGPRPLIRTKGPQQHIIEAVLVHITGSTHGPANHFAGIRAVEFESAFAIQRRQFNGCRKRIARRIAAVDDIRRTSALICIHGADQYVVQLIPVYISCSTDRPAGHLLRCAVDGKPVRSSQQGGIDRTARFVAAKHDISCARGIVSPHGTNQHVVQAVAVDVSDSADRVPRARTWLAVNYKTQAAVATALW